MTFLALDILSIQRHLKVVVNALHQLSVHSEPILHHKQILAVYDPCGCLFFKLSLKSADKRVAHLVSSTNEGVAATWIVQTLLNENLSLAQNNSPDTDPYHIA